MYGNRRKRLRLVSLITRTRVENVQWLIDLSKRFPRYVRRLPRVLHFGWPLTYIVYSRMTYLNGSCVIPRTRRSRIAESGGKVVWFHVHFPQVDKIVSMFFSLISITFSSLIFSRITTFRFVRE